MTVTKVFSVKTHLIAITAEMKVQVEDTIITVGATMAVIVVEAEAEAETIAVVVEVVIIIEVAVMLVKGKEADQTIIEEVAVVDAKSQKYVHGVKRNMKKKIMGSTL